jgi:LPXTG-motif cell wall-anchored protein
MSSNYELQTGNDWVPKYLILLFQAMKTGKEPPADELEKAKQEFFACKESAFGCSFKNQDEVETFCNSKSDCIGYIKSVTDQINFTPLRKEPVILPPELKTNNTAQTLFFKKTGTMNKNTLYIIIGVVGLLILIGLFMFFRKSSDQDYQQPQDYIDEYPTQ